jgi:hypothetical protein
MLPVESFLQEVVDLLFLRLQQLLQFSELLLDHLLQEQVRLLQFGLVRLTHHQQSLDLLDHMLRLLLELEVLLFYDHAGILDRGDVMILVLLHVLVHALHAE